MGMLMHRGIRCGRRAVAEVVGSTLIEPTHRAAPGIQPAADAPAAAVTVQTVYFPDSFGRLPADENGKDVRDAPPARAASIVPSVLLGSVPAELILIRGGSQYWPVTGTKLLWVRHTDGFAGWRTGFLRGRRTPAGRQPPPLRCQCQPPIGSNRAPA